MFFISLLKICRDKYILVFYVLLLNFSFSFNIKLKFILSDMKFGILLCDIYKVFL